MREYVMNIGDKEYKAEVKSITTEVALIEVDGKEYEVELKQMGKNPAAPAVRPVNRPAPAAAPATAPKTAPAPSGAAGAVTAPLPGAILELLVSEGDSVKAGQDILVMEAMKMENKIQAPHDGTIKKIFAQPGANVAEGDPLLEISRPLMTTV